MQQGVHRHIFRYELRLPHNIGQRRAGAGGIRAGRIRYPFPIAAVVAAGQGPQGVADMNDAHHLIHRTPIHGQPGVPRGHKRGHHLGQGCVRGHGVHIQARRHNILDIPVVHPADGTHHINIVIVQVEQLGGRQRRRFGMLRIVVAGGGMVAVAPVTRPAVACPTVAVARRRSVAAGPAAARCSAVVQAAVIQTGSRQSARRLGEPRRQPVGNGVHPGQQQDHCHDRRRYLQEGRPARRQRCAQCHAGNPNPGGGGGQQQGNAQSGRAGQHRQRAGRAAAHPGHYAGPSEAQQRCGQKK